VHLSDFVADTGVVQDAFGSSSFTSIDVGSDTNISCEFEIFLCRDYASKEILNL